METKYSVIDAVIADLTTMYSDEPSFNDKKIAVIVNKVVEEVIKARRYKNEGYSDERIDADLMKYKSQIFNISEYDFSHLGAPNEITHSENSISRTWIDRSKLFAGILPISHI